MGGHLWVVNSFTKDRTVGGIAARLFSGTGLGEVGVGLSFRGGLVKNNHDQGIFARTD